MPSRLFVVAAAVLLELGTAACTARPAVHAPDPAGPAGPAEKSRVVAYFTDWSVYNRNYQVKDVQTSGAAGRLTDLVFAFGTVTGGRCAPGDAWADYQRPTPAAQSVDGVADSAGAVLRGAIGQLRKLERLHPRLKVLWSFGGWTGSAGFTAAARDPAAFAASCKAVLDDRRWAGVFDGIDIDWEYPNACGLGCDHSGPGGLPRLIAALRAALGPRALISVAATADAGKLAAGGFPAAARDADWLNAMTYDYFGTAADGPAADDDPAAGDGAGGPTEPHSPLVAFPGIPRASSAESTVNAMLRLGIPARKILLGIGFYGRGWTGVTDPAPGGRATGPAAGRYEKGIEDYAILAVRCPPTGTIGGTAYAHCGRQWWSYDTPASIKTKMAYAASTALGGAFAWELSGDTAHADLLTAMADGLNRS